MSDDPLPQGTAGTDDLDRRLAQAAMLRELYDHEHALLNERTNVLLICQSILMAGLALGSTGFGPLLLLLSILGLLVSVMWLYVGWRTLQIADHHSTRLCQAELFLPAGFRPHSDSHAWRSQSQLSFVPRISVCLAIILPLLWVVIWAAALTWRAFS